MEYILKDPMCWEPTREVNAKTNDKSNRKKSKIKNPRDTLYERTSKADEARRLRGSCIQWQIVASVRFAYYCAARLSTA